MNLAVLAGAAILLFLPLLLFEPVDAAAFEQSSGIPLFSTTLRGAGPGGIPVALPDRAKAKITGVTHYTLDIKEFQDQVLPAGFPKTTLWGYNPTIGLGGNTTPTHLGGIIIGKKNNPIQLTFRNKLNAGRHILPVDNTIPGGELAPNRTAVHLHGGLVPWISDGGPMSWFGPDGSYGMSFLNNQVLNPSAKDSFPGYAEYYYPLKQSARFMWYHDHAMGITRLNAYAGIASALLVRDDFEAGLFSKGLPGYIEAGGNEIPLVFQDKIFVGNNTLANDPTWTGLPSPGSLWYAHTYDPARWDLFNPPGSLPLPDPSSIPEFFADTMLVNGTVYPQATVQARRYRLRLLNACNARFLNLQLYLANPGDPNGITLDASGNPTNTAFVNAATGNSSFLQIGTEGGFLSKPVEVPSNVPFLITDPNFATTGSLDPTQVNKSLLVAPAERPDLIVDFSSVPPGTDVVLYNDAPAPFPMGDDVNDYFPGLNVATNPVNGTTPAGFGPNTRVLMRFHVVAASGPADTPLAIDNTTDLTAGIDPVLTPWGNTTPPPAVPKRFLTLNEYHDEYGRLIQILGNAAAPLGAPYDGLAKYLDYGSPNVTNIQTVGAAEEHVAAGATEVWEIYNATGDVHPMHIHLVNFQVINRELFTIMPDGSFSLSGTVIPPSANELGWKETVQIYPGTAIRLIMKFDLAPAQIVAANGRIVPTPPSPRTGGAEYVWHCHILEHEEHDMMHALVVK